MSVMTILEEIAVCYSIVALWNLAYGHANLAMPRL